MLKQYESTIRDSTNPSQFGSSHTPNVSYLVVRDVCSFTPNFHRSEAQKKGTDKWYDQSADCLPIRKKVEVAPKSDTRIKKSAGPVTDKRLGYARFPVP